MTNVGGSSYHSNTKIAKDGTVLSITESTNAVLYCTQSEESHSPPDKTPWVRGQFKITPLSHDKVVVKTTPGFVHWIRPYAAYDYHYKVSGDIMAKWGWTSFYRYDSMPDDRQLALIGAYAKVASAKVDLAVEMGEIGETARFLLNPFKSATDLITKFGRDIRRGWNGKRSDGKQRLGDLIDTSGSTYLEFRFALVPLLKSMAAIIEELDRNVVRHNSRKIHVARRVVKREAYPAEKRVNLSYGYFRGTAYGVTECTQRTKACVYYRLAKPLPTLQKWGLSPDNWIPSIWELTKWSFVVDRFICIGDWLQALMMPPEVEILGDTVSVRQSWKGSHTTRFWPPTSASTTVSWSPGRGILDREYYNREINAGVPWRPTLTALKTLDNWAHHADHAAILNQLLRGAKR
jgi:hypothetical protein